MILFLLLLLTKIELPQNQYILTNIEVYDADTITADIDLGYGVTLKKQKIRAASYDACEVTTLRKKVIITPEELEKGRIAKLAMESLIRGSKLTLLKPVKKQRDYYGRILGDFVVHIEDVNAKGKINRIEIKDYMKENKYLRSDLNGSSTIK